MGGGGDVTDEESALLLDSGPLQADVTRTAKLLASFGLRWPQAQSYRWGSGLTPAEEALLRAACEGDAVRVRELLAKGVRTDVTHRPGMFETPGFEGATPLELAIQRGAREAVVALLDGDIDVSGKNGVHLVGPEVLRREPEILRELLQRGASVHFEDGFDSLFWTARDCMLEVLKLVLEHGASFGPTPEREAKMLEKLRKLGRAEAADAIEEALRKRTRPG